VCYRNISTKLPTCLTAAGHPRDHQFNTDTSVDSHEHQVLQSYHFGQQVYTRSGFSLAKV